MQNELKTVINLSTFRQINDIFRMFLPNLKHIYFFYLSLKLVKIELIVATPLLHLDLEQLIDISVSVQIKTKTTIFSHLPDQFFNENFHKQIFFVK